MNTRLGLDPAEVRRLSRSLAASADELDEIRTLVSRRFNDLTWSGPDVQRLLSRWNHQDAVTLTAVGVVLRDAARVASENADEQVQASDVGGAGASSGGGGGVAGWLSDRVGDVGGWVGDRVEDVGGWVGDRVEDVGGWVGDRVEDVGGWVGDRFDAIADDVLNVGDAAGQLWDATGGSLLDGEMPRMTEVLASGIRLNGALTGAVVTTSTLGVIEANIYDDGHAVVRDVEKFGAPAPTSLASVMGSVTDAYDEDGTIRITVVDGPEGPRAIVAIPGTESWNPAAGANAADLTGNLVTAGGGRSTWSEGVALAIDKADLPPGTEVLLVGHSQGGMTAADLASDSAFVSKYNVTDVMTYGSPIDSEHIDPGVNVLEVQHVSDVVPKLDLGDLRTNGIFGAPQESSHHTTVTLADPDQANPWWSYLGPLPYAAGEAVTNHSYDYYAQDVAGSADPGLVAYEAQLRESGFLTEGAGRATTVKVTVGRED